MSAPVFATAAFGESHAQVLLQTATSSNRSGPAPWFWPYLLLWLGLMVVFMLSADRMRSQYVDLYARKGSPDGPLRFKRAWHYGDVPAYKKHTDPELTAIATRMRWAYVKAAVIGVLGFAGLVALAMVFPAQ